MFSNEFINYLNIDYKKKIHEIIQTPEYVCSPRGMKILEILNDPFHVDMDCPVLLNVKRKLNYSFMLGEAAWMLDGRNDVKTIAKYLGGIKRFSDDGVTFFGAYGPKIITQTSYIIKKLKEDQDSRQAVLTIWRENPIASKDVPCTLSMQFFLRKASDELFLHCITNMRSNDIWLGTPYDSFNFSAISFYIALFLNKAEIKCKLGKLIINAGSRHLYEENLVKAKEVVACKDTFPLDFSFNDLIEKYQERPHEFIRNLYQGAEENKNIPQVKLNYIKNG